MYRNRNNIIFKKNWKTVIFMLMETFQIYFIVLIDDCNFKLIIILNLTLHQATCKQLTFDFRYPIRNLYIPLY